MEGNTVAVISKRQYMFTFINIQMYCISTEPVSSLQPALVSSCSIQVAAMTTIQRQMSGQLPAYVSRP